MALELFMVGVVARDSEKSLEFSRRLGLAIPEGRPHVEVKMLRGLTFFVNAPGLAPSRWWLMPIRAGS